MSAGSAILDRGFRALVAHHGETLTWHPSSVVLTRENGEIIPTELGVPIITDESEAEVIFGIFNEAWSQINPVDGSIMSTAPAVMLHDEDIPDADRGDVILRDGVYYSVIERRPHGIGSKVLILSKHGH